jgi:hypothetical protein
MKTIGLGCVALLVACGGSGGTDIPDGSTDTGTDVTTSNDTGTNDTGASDAANDTSASDASDGSTFTPASVLGLVLWLEADVSSSLTLLTVDAGSPRVTEWADQTSHQNNAKGSVSLPGRDPTVNASAINSLPAVHFTQGGLTSQNGNELTIVDNTDMSLQWGTGDFYVAAVGDYDNAVANGANFGVGNFFSKSMGTGTLNGESGVLLYGNIPSTSNSNPTVGLFFATAASTNNFVVTTNAYNTGAAHLFAIRRRSNQLDILVDGASVATSTSTGIDVSNANTLVRIGADGDANLVRLDGDIGEMLAVKGALSLADEVSINAYLKGKWATP